MQHFNIITRRGFLDRSFKVGLGVALSTLVDIPLVVKRALAEGTIGLNGKKLLFIFLRGANDSLNSVIPIQDSAYATSRPTLKIPADSLTDYSAIGSCDLPISAAPTDPTFGYANAIRLGNGFAALHPSLKFLAPVYNAGDLALVHRVGYPKQSRSHFDSQNYWETGNPNNNLVKDGILYRAMVESGLANTNPLTGVSFQSSLPLILRGSAAAMTNLSDPNRYNLLGIPNTTVGNTKADNAVTNANGFPFPDKKNRELLNLQYKNLSDTLSIFASLNFTESGNTFRDDPGTDNDTTWANAATGGYYLFPTTNDKNGGWRRVTGGATDAQKYVVDTGAYSFFNSLKAAALILNKTNAIVAGTEMGGFDTHVAQGTLAGSHPNLQRRIAWAMYALRKYFLNYADKATWNNLAIITLSEFGRTTVENSDRGTDHAEAGVMFVAGGAVKGYNKGGSSTGVFGCHPSNSVPWITGQTGSMFGASSRYLKRVHDYRSVLGKLIRDHLGATQNQLNRIIPGYAVTGEHLQTGGTSAVDNTPIIGEPDIIV
ncbi:MAG: hypothetical protein DME21_13875 [Verrucomicrobia bacterium]|nr:MAG: hypothetical protein DME21_13875 [Verrucomicrobiota bacterium]